MLKVIVEQVPWLYACCDTLITAADVASASRFQNEHRRQEHLAWRRIVRRELGRDVVIEYNDVGAPVVNVENTYISVAHGGECVAVAISDSAVGVDIESLERDFSRAASRFMHDDEVALSSDRCWAAMVWTAKEAMYKLYGRRGVELKDDLRIMSYDAATQRLECQLLNAERSVVDISFYEGDIVVATAHFV